MSDSIPSENGIFNASVNCFENVGLGVPLCSPLTTIPTHTRNLA